MFDTASNDLVVETTSGNWYSDTAVCRCSVFSPRLLENQPIRCVSPLAVLVLMFCLPLTAQAPLPRPVGFVNDYAGVLNPKITQQLESVANELKEKANELESKEILI